MKGIFRRLRGQRRREIPFAVLKKLLTCFPTSGILQISDRSADFTEECLLRNSTKRILKMKKRRKQRKAGWCSKDRGFMLSGTFKLHSGTAECKDLESRKALRKDRNERKKKNRHTYSGGAACFCAVHIGHGDRLCVRVGAACGGNGRRVRTFHRGTGIGTAGSGIRRRGSHGRYAAGAVRHGRKGNCDGENFRRNFIINDSRGNDSRGNDSRGRACGR